MKEEMGGEQKLRKSTLPPFPFRFPQYRLTHSGGKDVALAVGMVVLGGSGGVCYFCLDEDEEGKVKWTCVNQADLGKSTGGSISLEKENREPHHRKTD